MALPINIYKLIYSSTLEWKRIEFKEDRTVQGSNCQITSDTVWGIVKYD